MSDKSKDRSFYLPLITYHCPVVSTKFGPVVFVCLLKPVPVLLEDVRQLAHGLIQVRALPYGAQVIVVRLVIREPYDFAVAEVAEQRYVAFANCSAQVA